MTMENQGILRVCTAYLPPLDYFAAILKAGSFCIDTDETYPKQTFRNRTCLVTSQGVLPLSLPCVRPKGNHTPVSDVLLDPKRHWAREHWRGIRTAYNKSPYLLYYQDELEALYRQAEAEAKDGLLLADFNQRLLDFVLAKLHLPVRQVPMEESRSMPVWNSLADVPMEANPMEVAPLPFDMDADGRPVFYDESFPAAGKDSKPAQVMSEAAGYIPPLDFDPQKPPYFRFDSYLQTFPCDANPAHLSILDLLFNCGPQSSAWLDSAILRPSAR